jgi:hypothetical protein
MLKEGTNSVMIAGITSWNCALEIESFPAIFAVGF